MRQPAIRARLPDERGMVGGFEALPFGFLVFMAGTLLLVNAWSVVDGKLAASAAAREAARTFVESDAADVATALAEAEGAARAAFEGHGHDADELRVTPVGDVSLQRCSPAAFDATYAVPTIRVPWVDAFGGRLIEVTARHAELVDPYRDGLPVDAGGVTCDG